MKTVKLKELSLNNFKAAKSEIINFADKTIISGENATGKTTIVDAFQWLLYDEDSTGSMKFNVRPLDENNDKIHFVNINVVATIEVDGKEITLSKTQTEKWVKKRGSENQKFEGNENTFEINGYPKSAKDYNDFISDLFDKELFKLVTNPTVFPALKWKEQREILCKLINNFSDLELAQKDDEFLELATELEVASTDDIKKKYQKALTEWKKKLDEIPARIDELNKQKKDIDISDLELKKNALKEQIDETEKQIEDSNSTYEEFQKKTDSILELKFKMSDIEKRENEDIIKKRTKLNSVLDEANAEFSRENALKGTCERVIERTEENIKNKTAQKEELAKNYMAEFKKEYEPYEELAELNPNDLICPTCGQVLTEEQKAKKIAEYEVNKEKHKVEYEASKKKFEEFKNKRLTDIANDGNALKKDIEEDTELVNTTKEELERHKKAMIAANGKIKKAMEELKEVPLLADLSNNEEYQSLKETIEKMEKDLKEMNSGADYRNQLSIKLKGLREELSEAERELAKADMSALDERIEELTKEQKTVGQKVADQEQKLYLLEKFVTKKMNLISSEINSKFKLCNFKLFEMQINGGIKECCELTVNGVPYSDLNNGHRIIAGLDIISTLSELYGLEAPIFIDNAESINEYKLPEIKSQTILLKVSDSKTLKVE